MMKNQVNPSFRYTETHEWIENLGSNQIRIGITDYAQDHLGDITYVECPEVGKTYVKKDTLGFVESVKAVSDIYAPLDLEITKVNTALQDSPELFNQSPYEKGWYIEAKIGDPTQLESLMNAEAYKKYIASENP